MACSVLKTDKQVGDESRLPFPESPASTRVSSTPIVGPARHAVVLKHLVVVGQSDLELVLPFLVLAPVFLAIALLLRHALVLSHDLLVVGDSARVLLVLEHAAHPQNGFLLRRVVPLFLPLSLCGSHVFTPLLVGPVPLVLGIEFHSLMVHCKEKFGCKHPQRS